MPDAFPRILHRREAKRRRMIRLDSSPPASEISRDEPAPLRVATGRQPFPEMNEPFPVFIADRPMGSETDPVLGEAIGPHLPASGLPRPSFAAPPSRPPHP